MDVVGLLETGAPAEAGDISHLKTAFNPATLVKKGSYCRVLLVSLLLLRPFHYH